MKCVGERRGRQGHGRFVFFRIRAPLVYINNHLVNVRTNIKQKKQIVQNCSTTDTHWRCASSIQALLPQGMRAPPPLSSPSRKWTERNERNESSTSADRDLTRSRSASSSGAAAQPQQPIRTRRELICGVRICGRGPLFSLADTAAAIARHEHSHTLPEPCDEPVLLLCRRGWSEGDLVGSGGCFSRHPHRVLALGRGRDHLQLTVISERMCHARGGRPSR